MDITTRIERIVQLARGIVDRSAFLGPTLARIAMGVVFVTTGWGKLQDLSHVEAFFAQLGIPAPGFNAPMVSIVELVGGILLLAGLFTRVAAGLLVGTMVVAILTAHVPTLHGVAQLFGLLEFAYLSLFVWLAVAGPGPLSLDYFVARPRDHRPATPVHHRLIA